MDEDRSSKPERVSTANPLHMPAEGLWWAPSFSLDDTTLNSTQLIQDLAASELGALRIRSLLSSEEAAAMVRATDQMEFVPAEESADRRNGALSWALHDTLCDALSARLAPYVARAICSHRGDASEERRGELLQAEAMRRALLGGGSGGPPLVRRCDGAPEGTYRLAGINSRCRVYRYEADGRDSFASHYDEVWPGSRLVMREGKPPQLEYDSWTYGEEEAESWQWGPDDRVSHLSLLIYLNDGFSGGETALLPENNPSGAVYVAPAAGDALCFGQSFQLGREGVQASELALLHEGRPLLPAGVAAPKGAAPNRQVEPNFKKRSKKQKGTAAQRRSSARAAAAAVAVAAVAAGGEVGTQGCSGIAMPKYVMRSDVLYWMPPPE